MDFETFFGEKMGHGVKRRCEISSDGEGHRGLVSERGWAYCFAAWVFQFVDGRVAEEFRDAFFFERGDREGIIFGDGRYKVGPGGGVGENEAVVAERSEHHVEMADWLWESADDDDGFSKGKGEALSGATEGFAKVGSGHSNGIFSYENFAVGGDDVAALEEELGFDGIGTDEGGDGVGEFQVVAAIELGGEKESCGGSGIAAARCEDQERVLRPDGVGAVWAEAGELDVWRGSESEGIAIVCEENHGGVFREGVNDFRGGGGVSDWGTSGGIDDAGHFGNGAGGIREELEGVGLGGGQSWGGRMVVVEDQQTEPEKDQKDREDADERKVLMEIGLLDSYSGRHVKVAGSGPAGYFWPG